MRSLRQRFWSCVLRFIPCLENRAVLKLMEIEEEEFHDWRMRESEMDNEPFPGWLCWCGHWQDNGLHCTCCGNDPPQGCDCTDCEDIWLRSYQDDDEWLWYWEEYPGELLTDNLDFGSDTECAEGSDECD